MEASSANEYVVIGQRQSGASYGTAIHVFVEVLCASIAPHKAQGGEVMLFSSLTIGHAKEIQMFLGQGAVEPTGLVINGLLST